VIGRQRGASAFIDVGEVPLRAGAMTPPKVFERRDQSHNDSLADAQNTEFLAIATDFKRFSIFLNCFLTPAHSTLISSLC
jgi:hypothetical protein